ncbi:NAD-dependent epimerase/dehydratase family protein [Chthonobacter albigriseus]|uniref:NAD-dependent epimerase/dehydratase family protein n=1 Tax=Chthonobacter albigriseus TaxID=1683161 RepID=UPI0015EFD784|nr:NAD-dependent epimerase/dehydratase family protein [Chthonobacter albigriseus]
MSTRTALVLGATGGIGGEVARTLKGRGWTVRALHRDAARAGLRDGIQWITGDALSPIDVTAAADGASLLVHAVNPPGYRNWGSLVLPMLDSTLAAARSSGARILLPGTVYNYGPDALPNPDELSVQHPVTAKGRIRVEMERRLLRAAEAGHSTAVVVRAGDFFGPRAANNWFSQGLVKPGKRPASIAYPGRPDVGHQWAYLPDVAETMVRVIETRSLGNFATFHMEGHWDPNGMRMVEAIRRVVGAPDLPVRRLPWTLMRLLGPVVPLFRELAEMRYLWEQPVRMRNDRLLALIGEEPRTPLDDAVRATLIGLGCLGAAANANASALATASQGRV